mmetsp:Transcript_68606/g.151001  ORF Transcript_68606/g.151001 Transcript_68606/m.151001 type:complete len:285 (-) Transcript_68606:197-1051(-)
MGNSGSTDFTYEDVPDQTGKTVLITGANLGLGFALTGDYINKTKAAKVIMACRSKEKCEEAMKKLGNDPRLCFLQLDLSDFDSVKKAAKDLSSMLGTSKLDALILNAGALNLEKASTKQGLEATMGVCHFGHFLFTALAWPMLSAEARIVPVSSVGHTWTKKGIDFEDLNWEKRDYDAYEAYFQAKLANVYFTKEIGRRCGAKNLKITAVTLSPGFGRSGLYRDFSGWQDYLTSFISEENEKLSINTMRAATDMTLKNVTTWFPSASDSTVHRWSLHHRISPKM